MIAKISFEKNPNKIIPIFFAIVSILIIFNFVFFCGSGEIDDNLFTAPMAKSSISSIGVVIEEQPVSRDGSKCLSGLYVLEVLKHAGLFFNCLDKEDLSDLPKQTRILILPYDMRMNGEQEKVISNFVKNGGSLIGVGGTSGLDEVFGCKSNGSVFESYIKINKEHRVISGLQSSLHVFKGAKVNASNGKSFAKLINNNRDILSDAFIENKFGKGIAVLIAVDIFHSIVHIQQGIAIEKDGIPSPDSSAMIDDGILKVEDGMVLNWDKDRSTIGPDDNLIFLHPIVDELREIFLKSIFFCAEKQSLVVPILWYWQKGMPAIAMMSHDSDGNVPELAWSMYRILEELQIKTTWCIMYPGGYDQRLYQKLKENGYEIALHYDAKTDGKYTTWSRENFNFQYDWLIKEAGIKDLITNKNHYTRLEGRLDFFHWCEQKGIQSDQTYGPSKKGTVGFSHSGSHPWFPIDDENDGRFIDVLEICMLTQDLVVTCPEYYGEYLVNSVLHHHGAAHFLFHPAHIEKNIDGVDVADALRNVVHYAQKNGMEWVTNAEINEWERKRRRVRLWKKGDKDKIRYRFFTKTRLKDATLLFLLPKDLSSLNILIDGSSTKWTENEVYGFRWAQVIIDLDKRRSINISPIFNGEEVIIL